MKNIHLNLYRHIDKRTFSKRIYYSAFCTNGNKPAPESILHTPDLYLDQMRYRLITSKKLPSFYHNPAYQSIGNKRKIKYVGDIVYSLRFPHPRSATSIYYYPKKSAGHIKGLGYYIELITLHDLSSHASRLSCSDHATRCRMRQMESVGLKPFKMLSIEEWKHSLAQGVRKTSRDPKQEKEESLQIPSLEEFIDQDLNFGF